MHLISSILHLIAGNGRRLSALLLFLPLAATGALAQEAVRAELFPVSFDGRPYEGLYLLDETEKHPVRPAIQNLPAPLSYTGPASVALYRDIRNAEGLLQPFEVVRFTLPASGRYLAFFTGDDEKPRVQLIPFPAEDFPVASARFLNATGEQLLVRLGTHNLQVEPGPAWSQAVTYSDFLLREQQETVINVEDGQSTQETITYKVSSVPILVAHRNLGKPSIVIDAQIDLQNNARLSVILYADKYKEREKPRYRMRILHEKVTQ